MDPAPVVRAEATVLLAPREAFDALVEALGDALARSGLALEPGPAGGVRRGERVVGRVLAWEPGERALLEWRPSDWEPDRRSELELTAAPEGTGARVAVEHRGLEGLLGDGGAELLGWFGERVAAPLVRAAAPDAMGDWLTDRRARRPSGAAARDVYRDPTYHRPNFGAILDALALTAGDVLLEVGCGGGALLHDALESGCRAMAVDHSADMVRLARAANAEAAAGGRLEIRVAGAERLPFPTGSCTCAAMTGVLGFLPAPVRALAEIRRVLAPGGRFVLFTGAPELRGTMAAPEPMAGRLRFYEDDELARLALDAGFAAVRVERPDLSRWAGGLPEGARAMFSSERRSGQLLHARAPTGG